MSLKGQSLCSLEEDKKSVQAEIRIKLIWDLPMTILNFVVICFLIHLFSEYEFYPYGLITSLIGAFCYWQFYNFRYFYRLWRIRRELARKHSQGLESAL